MIIRQSSVNIVYPRLSDYRRKFILSEDTIKKNFMPATLLPVPDDVQEDVPRIIIQTRGGHSILNIALNVTSFTTTYNNDFTENWGKCCAYLKERCTDVYEIVNQLTEQNSLFVGLVVNIEFPDIEDDGLDLLKKSILRESSKSLGNPDDISTKLTYIYKDRYYINITLGNKKQINPSRMNEKRSILYSGQRNIIGATLDINDRYALNTIDDYQSSKEAFDEIILITSRLIESKLLTLIKKGEYQNDY